MSGNWKKKQTAHNEHSEDFRIDIDLIFRDFTADEDLFQYTFPSILSNVQRKYIHERCRKFGLKSKSSGKDPNRILSIFKKPKTVNNEYCKLSLSKSAMDVIHNLFNKNLDLSNFHDSFNLSENNFRDSKTSFGMLNVPIGLLVDPPVSNHLKGFRESLPVFEYRQSFLNILEHSKVIIISAETGSGKTTQIPQYILESCCAKQKKCKIICTQPRRISTIAVAERVATERGEKLGQTVGYQIKLESKLGIKTSLVYCTTGVLLRTLMNGDECFKEITHIIVDEIHERDKFSDFLLICLRESVLKYSNLRIVLMSATMDIGLYKSYFHEDVKTLYIPGRTYPITELFLDDILPMIKYESDLMKSIKTHKQNEKNNSCDLMHMKKPVMNDIGEELSTEMDTALEECMNNGSDENFAHLMQLILCDSVPVNYADIINGYNAVIVAAAHGKIEVLEQLLNLGADITQLSRNGYSANEWATYHNQQEVVELINAYKLQNNVKQSEDSDLLSIYDKTISDDIIDFDLILSIVIYIHQNYSKNGAILIFLPGYDDIINCHEKISNSCLNMNDIHLCLLHGSMQISSQHDVFRKIYNKQKIILSTNVAETSITIDDVCFVIDSGRAKEKTYDSISGTSALQTCWISMACVKQRAGRAGRTQAGICFHIFSKIRYESLLMSTTPEILRVPLHELCLQTKLLAPIGTSIGEFLALAIEPPSLSSIGKAITALVMLGALDQQENLTPLGKHLLQLSVEPHLGKMLIYSVIFKCVDPVLTIVSTLAHKDPFILPSKTTLKTAANTKRKLLSSGTLSDHMCFLQAFQLWQDAKVKNSEQKFCAEYYLSVACMEMIMMTRVQLLGQLRAAGFIQSNHRETIQGVNLYAENWPLIKAVLAVGLYPNIAFVDQAKLYTKNEKKVILHTSSCLRNTLFEKQSNCDTEAKDLWVIYEELSKTGKMCNIKCGTVITPCTVALTCGSTVNYNSETGHLTLDAIFEFELLANIWQFRSLIDCTIQKKIKNPHYRLTKVDENILATLVHVLSAEDSTRELIHPAGIGERPKILYNRSNDNKRPRSQNYNTSYSTNRYGSSSHKREFRLSNHAKHQQCVSFSNNQNYKSNQHAVKQGLHQSTQVQQLPQNSSRFEDWRTQSYNQKQYDHINQNPSCSTQQHSYFKPKTNIHSNIPREFDFPDNVIFFIIKPSENKNILISLSQETWNFSPQTEKKLFKHFNEGWYVALLFTVRASNQFQGVAHLIGTNKGIPNTPCPIEWLGTNSVSYSSTKHLLHPKIHIAEDGQYVNPDVGRKISKMLMEIPDHRDRNIRPILGNPNRSLGNS